MKIYMHEYDATTKEVRTKEIDVTEKPKTYTVVNAPNTRFTWVSRILKEDIDKLQGRYIKRMYTLSPDKTAFIKALVEAYERTINAIKKELSNAVESKTALLKMLDQSEKN